MSLPVCPGPGVTGYWNLEGGHTSGTDTCHNLLPTVSSSRSPRRRTTSQCKSEPPLLRTSKRTIYTAGRPPWYNEHGAQSKEAFVIAAKQSSSSK
ncbi:hypothetical protein FKM82_022455 [Ascaphus truei]